VDGPVHHSPSTTQQKKHHHFFYHEIIEIGLICLYLIEKIHHSQQSWAEPCIGK
jgi:hypothetical protein